MTEAEKTIAMETKKRAEGIALQWTMTDVPKEHKEKRELFLQYLQRQSPEWWLERKNKKLAPIWYEWVGQHLKEPARWDLDTSESILSRDMFE